jgi:FAD/FMN-containing dehydrogenase
VRDFHRLIAGAPNRVAPNAMAYGHRDAKFVLNVHGRWDEAKDDQKCIGWARDFFRASAPYGSAGAYIKFMTAEEGDRVAASYGASYERLVELKRRYDPENIFHLNQNIKP